MSWLAFVAALPIATYDDPGRALAAPGDVDGDGTPDLVLVGRAAFPRAPRVWVISGRTGEALHTLTPLESVRGFGWDVDATGDVNGDGRGDFIVGVDDSEGRYIENWRFGAGRALVVSGADGSTLFELCVPQPGGSFGRVVAGGGDLDGDGFGDFLVADPERGRVHAYSSADGRSLFTLDERARLEALPTLPWPGIWRGFGCSLEFTADLDDDGCVDVLVGTRMRNERVLVSGADGRHLRIVEPGGEESEGAESRAIGDLDGDGLPDRARYLHAALLVHLVSGADAQLLRELDLLELRPDEAGGSASEHEPSHDELARLEDRSTQSLRGRRILAVGDVDGDGLGDVALANRWRGTWRGRGAPGVVWVFSGSDGTLLRELRPERVSTRFGNAMSRAGDVDGDGLPDLIVAADDHPYDLRLADGRVVMRRGLVFVFSGADGRVLLRLQPPEREGRFGASVAGGEDLDGDGVPEVVVGAPARGGGERGALHVFSGADGSLLRSLRRAGDPGGLAEVGRFGERVVCLPDEDGDGLAELAAFVAPGVLRAFSGRTGRALGARFGTLRETLHASGYESLGPARDLADGHWSCAPGDLDGDGVVDFACARRYGSALFVVSGASGARLFEADALAEQ